MNEIMKILSPDLFIDESIIICVVFLIMQVKYKEKNRIMALINTKKKILTLV